MCFLFFEKCVLTEIINFESFLNVRNQVSQLEISLIDFYFLIVYSLAKKLEKKIDFFSKKA
jgi:hypothetical protein